jgi:SEC-C motif
MGANTPTFSKPRSGSSSDLLSSGQEEVAKVTERPYPLNQPKLTADLSDVLANHGAEFDGSQWLLVEEMLHPYPEIFYIAAVDRASAHQTGQTMELGFALARTSPGFVLDATITLTDHPRVPTVLNTYLNPAATEARDWLHRLRRQELVNVLMMDKDSGERIKMTRLPFHIELRESLSQILELTRSAPTPSPTEWQASLDSYLRNTPPAAGHIRLAPEQRSGVRIGRNDPCPCGSEKKFKRCCGN